MINKVNANSRGNNDLFLRNISYLCVTPHGTFIDISNYIICKSLFVLYITVQYPLSKIPKCSEIREIFFERQDNMTERL